MMRRATNVSLNIGSWMSTCGRKSAGVKATHNRVAALGARARRLSWHCLAVQLGRSGTLGGLTPRFHFIG